MKGVGWEASKSLDVQQAKKAGELVSEVAYDPECIAEISCRQAKVLNIVRSNRARSALAWFNSSPTAKTYFSLLLLLISPL